jgi:RND family efflux transporter MFP subunit
MTKTGKFFIISAIILLGIITCAGLILMKKPPAGKVTNLHPTIRTMYLTQEKVIPQVSEYGVIETLEEVKLRAQVSGKIVKCNYTDDGKIVKKGQIILQIEKNDYEINKDKAEAELEILEANYKRKQETVKNVTKMLNLIKKDYELEQARYDRAKKLYDRKVYSKNDIDTAQQIIARKDRTLVEMSNTLSQEKFSLESIKAQIKKAKALVLQAKLNLERTSVIAPINGRIDDCDINEGDFVKTGDLICKIINEKTPSITVAVDAKDAIDILKVMPGEKHWLELPDQHEVAINWVKEPDACLWNGKISRIKDYDSDTDTLKILIVPTTYKGNASVPFPLLTGMFCQVNIKGNTIDNAYKIPFSAVQFGDNVFTVNSKNKLERHHIKIFHIEGDMAIIKTGLPPKAQIVIQQLPRGLIEGMKVTPYSSPLKSPPSTSKRKRGKK